MLSGHFRPSRVTVGTVRAHEAFRFLCGLMFQAARLKCTFQAEATDSRPGVSLVRLARAEALISEGSFHRSVDRLGETGGDWTLAAAETRSLLSKGENVMLGRRTHSPFRR
jgi:hypothetical protein